MGRRHRWLHRCDGAFSLLELLVVIIVIAILATLLIPMISTMKGRAQRVQCMTNLRSLYVAANLYVQQNNSWPQIPMGNSDSAEQQFANDWIKALQPFGPTQKTWICPTIQDLMGNPDLSDSNNARIDYLPTSFDNKPTTPNQWPQQPWFGEVGDVHGNGNLIIFTDGSIQDLNTVAKKSRGQ